MNIMGNTVGTTTNPKRVLTNPGELTPEEQAQVRAKIGAAAVGEVGGGGGGGGCDSYYRATDYGISTDAESNTLALQALIDEVSAKGGGIIFFPVGTYNFKQQGSFNYRWAVEMKSNVSIIGENIEKTVLKQTEEKPYSLFGRILDNGGGAADPLTGCVFKNFTVDAYATGNVNHVCGKAFFFQYVRDCVFRDLILRGTVATALGIDFLDRVVIDNVSCIDCGRTFTGNEAGTSGIGIGTAGWENENFIITNCICVGSGQYGIFIENQGIFYEGNVPYAKGCIISNCIVRNGINKGIGVRGGQNVTIIGCESYENTSHGIFIDNNCKNVKVLSCSSANNGGAGIYITPNNTEHLVIKGCTFVNNQAEGISVNVEAGKYANKLCIQDCYTDGNSMGIDLSATYLEDCVILGNATLDGVNNGTTFLGNTSFNNLINNVDPDSGGSSGGSTTPSAQSISVPYSSMTNGKKLMPDGSIADGELGGTLATENYINVSGLSDTFILRYPDTVGCSIRIAQYDSSKTSLSTSFGLDGPTETANGYKVWNITKLEGCQYIRIFLSGAFGELSGELRSIDGSDSGGSSGGSTTPIQSISVPYSSLANGKKLMPDGSIADGELGGTLATENYINVSGLSDTFILRYPDTVGCSIRIAQYDSSKTSLSTSFGLDGPTETANGYKVWKITKLDGCQYIRIFVSGTVGGLSGELRSEV